MLRCDLRCLLTSSVKELRLAPSVAPHCLPLVVRTLPLLACSAKLLAWRSESCCPWRWHRFSALKARRPFCRKVPATPEPWTCAFRFPVLPTICDAGRQSHFNHSSSLLAPATELPSSTSLANSHRDRDQESRTYRSFGCAERNLRWKPKHHCPLHL